MTPSDWNLIGFAAFVVVGLMASARCLLWWSGQ